MLTVLLCLPKQLKVCLLCIFLISGISCIGVDKTREPNTSGVDVVKATLRQIQDSHIFPNDNGFLRRLAYVESQDGTDPMTYRDGYHGGIWQIEESLFDMTKTGTLVQIQQQIATKFKIVWVNMAWNDLRKPLYSALAASMYMTLTSDPIPPVYAVPSQAEFWITNFSTDQSILKIEADFLAAAEALKSEECRTARLDVAFVVDGSGSIKEAPFNIAKAFVADIVDNFDIGPDGVRVGFIQYESSPTVEFNMNQYQDKTSLQAAIQNIGYGSGGTQTGRAITTMISSLFGDGNGTRNRQDKVPRIGIVMTDGNSGDVVLGPAEAARVQDITLYAIGIGPDINDTQLQEIANNPDDEYVFHVNDFSVIDNIRYEISQVACEEPSQQTVGEKLNSSLNAVSKLYFESDVPSSGKMTFTLTASKGKATAYLSTLIRNPNEAFHQWSVEASEENPLAQVYIDTNVTTEDEGSRKKRQVSEDDARLQLYGTIINTYEESEPNSEADMATGSPETVFSVLVEEGDTRIIVPTTETAFGLSAGAISGVYIALFVNTLFIVVVLAFVHIKRTRAKEPEPKLIRRGMSTVSTMSAEMAQQEPYSEPYRIGSASASIAHAQYDNYQMGAQGRSCDDEVEKDYTVKPGHVEPEDEASDGNLHTVSAEMAQQEPYSEPYRIGSPSTSSAHAQCDNYQMGAQGRSCDDEVEKDYTVKPGHVEPEDEVSNGNLHTADPNREPMHGSSIYEVETVPDKQDDSVYAV